MSQTKPSEELEEVTNIICASVLLDMSTPDKNRVAEKLDSRRNWRRVSIYSCFLGWREVWGQRAERGDAPQRARTSKTGDRC